MCEPVSLQLVYHSLQLVAFAVLAVLIMRLKLFLTPHMCIMASLVCSKQVGLSPPQYSAFQIFVFLMSAVKSIGCCSVPASRSLPLCPGQLFGWIGERFKHQIVVFAVMALMAVQGVVNLQTQWAIIGEFSNLPQEELLDWIQQNTRPGG